MITPPQKQQSGFALPIAILIAAVLIVAGGSGYYFYKMKYKYSSPEKTFSLLTKAAEERDADAWLECYTEESQKMLRGRLEEFKTDIQFYKEGGFKVIEKTSDRAVMISSIPTPGGILVFKKEKGNWKIDLKETTTAVRERMKELREERRREELKKEIEILEKEESKAPGAEISCKDSLDCPSQMRCENSVCVDVGCIKEGEIDPSAGISPEWLEHLPTECCEGLKSITYAGNFDENCKFMPPPGAPAGVCSKCGNRICEEWETKCNCPEDCFPAPNTPMMLDIDVSTTAGKPYTIAWKAISEATNYILERDTNSSFSNPVTVYSGQLNSFSGVLSPSVSTTYYFRVKACNNYGCSSWSKTTELWVEACPLPETPVLTDPGTSVNKGESFTLNWTSVSGATKYQAQRDTNSNFSALYPIPPDSEQNSRTDSPKPEITTTYYYRVRACNDCGCSAWSNVVDMRVVVPSITVISPNGGEVFHYGEYFIRKARVDSRKSGKFSYYLINSIGNKILIDEENTSPSEDGQFYIMGSMLIERSPLLPAGINYKAFVTFVSDDGSEKLEDYSDDFFSITEAASTLSALALISPNGGEIWETGKTYRIKWDSIGGNDFVRIYIVDDSILGSGSTNYIIPDNGSAPVEQGYYDWIIDKKILPVGKGNNYKIRIDGVYNSSISDKSDAPFSILP